MKSSCATGAFNKSRGVMDDHTLLKSHWKTVFTVSDQFQSQARTEWNRCICWLCRWMQWLTLIRPQRSPPLPIARTCPLARIPPAVNPWYKTWGHMGMGLGMGAHAGTKRPTKWLIFWKFAHFDPYPTQSYQINTQSYQILPDHIHIQAPLNSRQFQTLFSGPQNHCGSRRPSASLGASLSYRGVSKNVSKNWVYDGIPKKCHFYGEIHDQPSKFRVAHVRTNQCPSSEMPRHCLCDVCVLLWGAVEVINGYINQ